MHLYIANATHHVVNFSYRIPEQRTLRTLVIKMGEQERVPEDLNPEAIDYVIEQHARYGLIQVSEIDRAKEFKGTCYSIDKPVPGTKIGNLMAHNRNQLVEIGRKFRSDAAVSSNQQLENQLAETDRPETLRNFEMSVVEEDHDDRDETPAIAEGFRVKADGTQPQPQQQQRARRRGKQ